MDFWTRNTTRAFSCGHFGVHTANIVIKLPDSLEILAPQEAQTFKNTRSGPRLIPFFTKSLRMKKEPKIVEIFFFAGFDSGRSKTHFKPKKYFSKNFP